MENRTYKELLNTLMSVAAARTSKISDFNEGSIIRTIFEAVARIVESAYIDTRIGYESLLKQIAYSLFDFEKKSGTYAGVEVVFSRSQALDTITTIPIGTRVSDGTHVFETTETATVGSGETESNSVNASAMEVGVEYNVGIGAVNIIESSVPGDIVEVTNAAKAEGGTDEESDADARLRFKDYINGLQGTSVYGVKAGLLAIDGVRSVGIIEHYPPKQSVYNYTVYIDDGTGHMTRSLETAVRNIIDGDGTETNPGLRACGINVEILAASIVTVNVSVNCTTYRTAESVALSDITETITAFINNLKISDDVLLTDLIISLRQISYITDVSHLAFNGTEENLSIADNQIARLGTLDITIQNT